MESQFWNQFKVTRRAALVAGVCLLFGLPAGAGDATNITVKGSDTLVILAQKWAETYMKSHPGVQIQVTGGGSGVGIAALLNGETDIADASRKMKPKEQSDFIIKNSHPVTEYKVAVDGLSVYVNNDNPIKALDVGQLEGIFTGKIKNWSEVGGKDAPITIYSRENSSGTYEFFKEHVLHGKDFAASAQTMPGTAALLQAVEKDASGIGYGGAAYGEGARAIGVKKTPDSPAIEPTKETVLNETYPIWRYLYNYVDPSSDKDAIAAYLNWIRGNEGQQIVEQVGYYPLPDKLRVK